MENSQCRLSFNVYNSVVDECISRLRVQYWSETRRCRPVHIFLTLRTKIAGILGVQDSWKYTHSHDGNPSFNTRPRRAVYRMKIWLRGKTLTRKVPSKKLLRVTCFRECTSGNCVAWQYCQLEAQLEADRKCTRCFLWQHLATQRGKTVHVDRPHTTFQLDSLHPLCSPPSSVAHTYGGHVKRNLPHMDHTDGVFPTGKVQEPNQKSWGAHNPASF